VLTLDSPHNRNALSSQLLDELAQGLHDATGDAGIRAIVITATGPVFCSGADLSDRAAPATSQLPEILTLIRASHVPVIARVNGHARAGGIGIVAASDFAVAPRSATFAFSEVRIGVAPAMIMVPAGRVMGHRAMAHLMLTGEKFGADEAAQVGLLTAVAPDGAALDAWVQHNCDAILRSAPGAIAATKALLAELSGLPWVDALSAAQRRSAELFAGAEAAEGIDAFMSKRLPVWDVTGP